MSYADKSSIELRKILSNKYDGRSSDVRSFVKSEHIWMLENEVHLDDMIERRDNGEYPYTADGGDFDPDNKRRRTEPTQSSTSDKFSSDKVQSTDETQGSHSPLEQAIISAVLDTIDTDSLVKDKDLSGLVEDMVQKHIQEVKQIHWEVVKDGSAKQVGVQHKQFEKLMQIAQTREPIALRGPAGGGKTTAAENMADALDLDFYSISCNPQTTKTDFFGYNDANGEYVETAFYQAVKYGGVFMADEMDAADASILTATNAATGGNKYVGFPNGLVEVHEDFIFIAGMNTYGQGANRMYVGRNQLDAATLDRFVFMDWKYDEQLERQLAGNDDWVDTVVGVRETVEKLGIRMVVSPRASIKGAKLLDAGFAKHEVMDMIIYKGIDKTTRKNIEAEL